VLYTIVMYNNTTKLKKVKDIKISKALRKEVVERNINQLTNNLLKAIDNLEVILNESPKVGIAYSSEAPHIKKTLEFIVNTLEEYPVNVH
jgi:molecular chaperone GrpE (heat shock protein)